MSNIALTLHLVKRGDTLRSVAAYHGVEFGQLLAANDGSPYLRKGSLAQRTPAFTLSPGEKLVIPTPPPSSEGAHGANATPPGMLAREPAGAPKSSG